ncbi:hypothetical protein [uncultured Nonlabens sp.]|uniref:hypothetical protein n=1 Tax=uncultured Nonlabens sp. TaxID=859306 RepID=UPI002632A838|nr:hypothetical protein [uncultured Nonlabens sp.]
MNLSNIWCWLLPLLTGIISGIIGYYWGKSNSVITNDCDDWIDKNKTLQSEIDQLKDQLKSCEINSSSLKNKVSQLTKNSDDLKIKASKAEADARSLQLKLDQAPAVDATNTANLASGFVAGAVTNNVIDSANEDSNLKYDADAAKAAMGKRIKPDDLTIVEGIGPKISELFHAAGIRTWYKLSQTDPVKLKEILNNGGSRFQVHQPGSWPKQAAMAFKGEWSQLSKWQDEHKGGKE